MTESEAFVELAEDVLTVAPGDPVQVLPFATLF
ncbi:hypothetical protein ACFQY5_27370 [Paeniroseomonas aquatica]